MLRQRTFAYCVLLTVKINIRMKSYVVGYFISSVKLTIPLGIELVKIKSGDIERALDSIGLYDIDELCVH